MVSLTRQEWESEEEGGVNDDQQGHLTWVGPLHAVREGLVGDEVVPSPAWVGDDDVG